MNHAAHMDDVQPDNGYDKNGKKINNNGGDTTDYRYDDSDKVISSTSVKIIRSQGVTNGSGDAFRVGGEVAKALGKQEP